MRRNERIQTDKGGELKMGFWTNLLGDTKSARESDEMDERR